MAAIARPDQSESVSFARYRKKSPSELRRDAHRAMTRQQQLLAQGQSVKPSKDDISSTQVTDTNFALHIYTAKPTIYDRRWQFRR